MAAYELCRSVGSFLYGGTMAINKPKPTVTKQPAKIKKAKNIDGRINRRKASRLAAQMGIGPTKKFATKSYQSQLPLFTEEELFEAGEDSEAEIVDRDTTEYEDIDKES